MGLCTHNNNNNKPRHTRRALNTTVYCRVLCSLCASVVERIDDVSRSRVCGTLNGRWDSNERTSTTALKRPYVQHWIILPIHPTARACSTGSAYLLSVPPKSLVFVYSKTTYYDAYVCWLCFDMRAVSHWKRIHSRIMNGECTEWVRLWKCASYCLNVQRPLRFHNTQLMWFTYFVILFSCENSTTKNASNEICGILLDTRYYCIQGRLSGPPHTLVWTLPHNTRMSMFGTIDNSTNPLHIEPKKGDAYLVVQRRSINRAESLIQV